MLVDMIEDLLGLFQKEKKFKSYTLDGQMAAVMDYLEIRPDRENQIRNLVRRKKLFIGPWYILNDEFLSSGESHIRNLQFGFRMGKSLGGVMNIGYIPDQFGHIAQMPQILQGFNIDTAMIYRGFGGEPGQEESEYRWLSPDGSGVLMHHMPKDGYSAGYFGDSDEKTILQKFERLRKELDARATTSQRLFFNGGDHHWPDETVTKAIKVLRKHYDAHILHSNFVDYFSALKKEVGKGTRLRTLNGETRFGYRHAFVVLGGVYSSRMPLKQLNAASQVLMERVLEPLNVLAMMSGMPSKSPQIEQGWKYVIQNQDHDAICGTSADEVHQEMTLRYKKAEQIGAHVSHECFSRLLPYDEHAHGDERYLVVFNPSPFVRSGLVETSVEFFLQDVVVGLNPEVKVAPRLSPVKAFRLLDPSGKEVPYQILARNEAFGLTYSKHDYPHQTLVDRFSVLVSAEQVSPLGWKGLKIEKTDAAPAFSGAVQVRESLVENEFLRVEASPDGTVKIVEKSTGASHGPLNMFEDSGDVGDEYNYSYPARDEKYQSTQFRPVINIVERGPLRASLRIDSTMQIPESASTDELSRSPTKVELQISTVLSLTPFSRRVDVKTTVHNTAKDHRLRALFGTGIVTKESYADTPFAVVQRTHQEYDNSQFPYEHPALVAPMQRFVTIADGQKGITLITKGLPEYELSVREPGVLALTLLRCVGKLSGNNLITRPGGAAGWWTETPEAQCIGTHIFEYSMFPHSPLTSNTWSSILREVELFTVPLLSLKRKNDQPVLERSFLSLDSAGLQFTTLKESEDRKGFIVRICNPTDGPGEGRLRFGRPVVQAHRCKLNEKAVVPLRIIKGAEIKVTAKPFEILTIKVRWKKT